MAKEEQTGKKDKPAKAAKGKKAKGKAAKGGPSIANHPRAAAQVRRAKGWGGLVGFGLAAYLSLHAGVDPVQAGTRALAGGIVGYLLAWACSVAVWRHLVLAELRLLLEGGQLVPGSPGRRSAAPASDEPADAPSASES